MESKKILEFIQAMEAKLTETSQIKKLMKQHVTKLNTKPTTMYILK